MSTPIITESAAQAASSTTETAQQVITSCKAQISAIGSSSKQLASDLAKLRDRFGLTQAAIADAVRKKQPWVSHMLDWYDADFKTDTPFGETSKAARQRKAARTKRTNYQATDNSGIGAEAAPRAEPGKTECAEAEASASKPFGTGSGDTTQVKRDTPAWWLSEFKVACQIYLTKLPLAELAEAKAFAVAWQNNIQLKVVA